MPNPNINIGDLVKLDDLEKPFGGILKVPIWGKSKNVRMLDKRMSRVAGKIEDQTDLQAGEVTGLVEVIRKALIRESSPEKVAKLLKILKGRFECKYGDYFEDIYHKKHYRNPEGIAWVDVRKKLAANPEKLWSLQQMEDTGGRPDLIDLDEATGEFVFMDCSLYCPKIREDCAYNKEAEDWLEKNRDIDERPKGNVLSIAKFMGVTVVNEKEYRLLHSKGEFGLGSADCVWLNTPPNSLRRPYHVWSGYMGPDGLKIQERDSRQYAGGIGWRGSLRV